MTELDKCPRCKRGVIELVPLYDDDQEHKQEMCCIDCKKKARKNGTPRVLYPAF